MQLHIYICMLYFAGKELNNDDDDDDILFTLSNNI